MVPGLTKYESFFRPPMNSAFASATMRSIRKPDARYRHSAEKSPQHTRSVVNWQAMSSRTVGRNCVRPQPRVKFHAGNRFEGRA